jgi:hypothetical protein
MVSDSSNGSQGKVHTMTKHMSGTTFRAPSEMYLLDTSRTQDACTAAARPIQKTHCKAVVELIEE